MAGKICLLLIENMSCTPIPITGFPLTINASGNYILCQNLTTAVDTLTINADNVDIDLNNFSITVTGNPVAFIVITGRRNIRIHNGELITTAVPSATRAILVTNGSEINFDNLVIRNFLRGIQFTGIVQGLNLKNVDFYNILQIGIFQLAGTVENLDVSNCDFTGGNNFAMFFQGTVNNSFFNRCQIIRVLGQFVMVFGGSFHNVIVRDCQFHDMVGVAINFDAGIAAGSNAIVEGCQFHSAVNAIFPLLQVGSFTVAPTSSVKILKCNFDTSLVLSNDFVAGGILLFNNEGTNSTIIENCTFIGSSATFGGIISGITQPGPDPTQVLAFSSNTCLIKDCVVDSIPNASEQRALFGISVGAFGPTRVQNCQIRNTLAAGIEVEGLVESVQLVDNAISNGSGPGIRLRGPSPFFEVGARNVLVNNNTINNHCNAGILIEAGARNNLIQNNQIFSNAGGIEDSDRRNVLKNNTLFNNNLFCDQALGVAAAKESKLPVSWLGLLKKETLEE